LQRYTDLFDAIYDELPKGCNVADMVPLYKQGAICFCTQRGDQCLWSFPGYENLYVQLRMEVTHQTVRATS